MNAAILLELEFHLQLFHQILRANNIFSLSLLIFNIYYTMLFGSQLTKYYECTNYKESFV